jgi:K+:H+ antiporter
VPHDLSLILTLTGGLTSALVLGLITQRLRLSPIVGYLLAGVLVGPFTPGFVADPHIAEQFAELGVILLMFGVGLHFHLEDLLAVRKVAIPGALVQIVVATGLGVLLTWAFDWSLAAGLVFGLAISVASTVVLLRVLSDNGSLHTSAGHVAVGWLIVEDLFTVLVLVLLPVLAGGSSGGGSFTHVAKAAGIAVLQIGGLCVFTLFVGKKLIVRLLNAVAQTRSRELFTLTVLVLALGIAVGSATLFGASMALGAFLAGMVVGQSDFGARAASEALPMRDAFAVLFFVSVGMLLDPGALLEHPGLVLGAIAIVLIGKSLAAFAVVRLLRYPVGTALLVALALAQIGEFSFILAALGRQLSILPVTATNVLVATSVVSITLNPVIFRLLQPLKKWLAQAPSPPAEGEHPPSRDRERAIVVGYGHVGQTVSQLLIDHQIEPTIVELNHTTVASLGEQGIRAVYGDASQQSVLEAAGVLSATSLIFAASGTPPEEVIQTAKRINPRLEILTRSTYLSERLASRKAGADVVVVAEAEVAFAMAEHLLRRLGATPEQIDRARDDLRALGEAAVR